MVLIRSLTLGFFLLIFTETVYSDSGPYCVVCDGTHSIGDCKEFHQCHHDEKCFIQEFLHDGKMRYYGGCADEDTCKDHRFFPRKRNVELITDHNENPQPHDKHGTYRCGGCCDGNECNLHLCGQKSNVIFCAVCNGERSITHCNQFAECPDQECYLQEYTKGHFLFGTADHYLFGGCATTAQCRNRQLRNDEYVGHNEELQNHQDHLPGYTLKCQKCCHDDSICNVELCDQKKYFGLPSHSTTAKYPKPTHKPLTIHALTTTQAPAPTTTKRTPTHPTTTLTTTKTDHMECDVCSGSTCGVTSKADYVVTCPASRPYCSTIVQAHSNGDKTISKGCATETDCQSKWWESAECISFHLTTNYTFSFTCSYCCTTPRCNKHMYPNIPNVYTGATH